MTPWVAVPAVSDAEFVLLRRRAIFECNKWDPQVGDVNVVSRAPLVLRAGVWAEVSELAAALAAETLAAEAELIRRPDLHKRLGLPRAVRQALASATHPSAGAARLVRFDFHHTDEGWQISEANTDVPGGLNEASGFAHLMAPFYPALRATGDPANAYAKALMRAAGTDSPAIALVHATAYSDDQQMMAFLAQKLAAMGARPHLSSPSHIRWRDGVAELDAAWWRGRLDAVVRFFPSDWLSMLGRGTDWKYFYSRGKTPQSNPSTAILTQSKRFPLVWDELETPLPTWRRLLPETRDPRKAPWRSNSDWVVKPALGRVGEGVGIMDAIDRKERRSITRSAWLWPGSWIAQRRFAAVPFESADGHVYPCLGVYTVDSEVVGAYGRLAPRPLIDSRASDAAVLQAA